MFYLKKANYLIKKKLLSVTLLIDIIRNNQYVVTEKKSSPTSYKYLFKKTIWQHKFCFECTFIQGCHTLREFRETQGTFK